MSEKKGDDVLTTGQVMEEYKISRTALWRLNKQGILKPIDGDDSLLTHPHENQYRRDDIERAAQIIAERRKNRGRKQAND